MILMSLVLILNHVGSPEKVMFYGVGIKASTEIQLSRNLVIYSTINQPIEDNFDRKKSSNFSIRTC